MKQFIYYLCAGAAIGWTAHMLALLADGAVKIMDAAIVWSLVTIALCLIARMVEPNEEGN